MDLLFLADEQEDMIDRYLDKGTMYVIDDNGVKGECVVTDEGEGILEIKNIATVPESHGKGYGRLLINYISDKYAGQYTTLQVGTGDSPLTIPFYEKCGFKRHHIIKNFFLDNYDHPIYEEGIQLVDMVYLRKEITKVLKTERLILRRWEDSDAEDLYKYARDPDVGPIAGWPPHQSVDESRDVIKNVLCGKETYAICMKEDGKPIGSIGLKLNGYTDMTDLDDECEMGYWLGKPFWGQGIMPEAVKEMLRHAFEDCGMQKVWIGYYEGNIKSRRVMEKCGFKYQWRTENVDVPLMAETRTGHVCLMTKDDWMDERIAKQIAFALEIDKEKNIYRQTHLSGHGRNETDAEHAWHMAIMAYLLREYANEEVDITRVILMCLIHDIVEIDAGDTYAYDDAGLATQKEREEKAKERIFSLLPDDQKADLISLFDEFEEYETAESKFAHAMDNFQPLMLNNSNDGGDWIEHNVTASRVYGRQSGTKLGSEKLYEITDQIIKENIQKGSLKE